MPIEFDCDCGKSLRVKDELAGRTIRCPECDERITVPEDEEPARAIPIAKPARPTPRVIDEDEEDERPSKRRRNDDDDDFEPRPKKRKKKKPVEQSSGSQAPIAIGCLMMVGAVVWFVVGLMADWVFFYPPILFILGMISVGRGVAAKM